MPVVRFNYRFRKRSGSRNSPGGYKLELLQRHSSGSYEPRGAKEVKKMGTAGQFNVRLPVSELSGTDFCIRISRKNGSGGALFTEYLRLGLPPTTRAGEASFRRHRFFDDKWSFSGNVDVLNESGLVPEGLRVRVEVRSGRHAEEPTFVDVSPGRQFEFEGWRMFLDPGDLFEHLLRVFTQNGIEVGRHYRASAPGNHTGIRIHCGRPFLDIWGDFRSTHPTLAARLERFNHDPKKAHKGDDTFLLFRRYDIKQLYQVAEGVVIKGNRGPRGDPDWVWNINLDRDYEGLGNDKNKAKHGGLHVEACRSLSRERLPKDGLAATDKTVVKGDRVWMLGTHVFDDAWDFGSPDHEHFELHPLYVMESCMGSWFHFAVFESIALAREAAKAGADGAGWPRTSIQAEDYQAYYWSEPEPKRRSDPADWKFEVAQTYQLIYDHYQQSDDKSGLARFFGTTSVRYDSLGVDSGLPGFPGEETYRQWARDRIKGDRAGEVRDALLVRLMRLYDFLYGSPSHGIEPVSGPAPQSLLRCVYARENQWVARATGGSHGESHPRIALNRATSRRTEAVRREMAGLYRRVFDSAADPTERGRLFAEAVTSYRQWAVKTTSKTEHLTRAELQNHGATHQPSALVDQMRKRVNCFFEALTPFRAK